MAEEMAVVVATTGATATVTEPSAGVQWRRTIERLRIVALAGVVYGVLMIGVGSRLAMFALRLSSSRGVRGLQSDDDFEIGRFTFGGSYNLAHLGAAVGMIGVAVYPLVASWLIGPAWFRRLTLALGSGAVVGSMLVHADGVDFTLLGPTWFAVGLFVALPAVFAAFLGDAIAYAERRQAWWNRPERGARRFIVPVLCVALFPGSAFALAIIALASIMSAVLFGSREWAELRGRLLFGLVVRACWLGVALLGLQALVSDVQALR